MPTAHLDGEPLGMGQAPTNGGGSDSNGFIKTYIKNRFDRLYHKTQPRAAIEKARSDFYARQDEERALANEESAPK